MKAIKSTLFALALSLLLGTPALAQTTSPALSNTLSAQDLELLFKQDGEPLQLALLSDQEMAETKGELWQWPILWSKGAWSLAGGGVLYADRYGGFYGSGSMMYGPGFWDFAVSHAILGMISATPALGFLVGVPYSVLVQQHGGVGNLMRYVRESASDRSL